MNELQIQHLFWRAGFGAYKSIVKANSNNTAKKIFNIMLSESKNYKAFEIPNILDEEQEMMSSDKKTKKNSEYRSASEQEKKNLRQEFAKKRRENLKDLNIAWCNSMSNEKGSLREKMAFFWHGHLVARSLNTNYATAYINTLRKYALGSFGDLLIEISKSAAMLQYLNNKQNKKQSPNENFARELMELFTLGRGNYTENDIKEVARAFTGWTHKPDGTFYFNEKVHDTAKKEIFGKTGNFDGDDVIKMILERKETAIYITQKIYKFFVNNTLDQVRIEDLANAFFKSNYNITDLLENIFTSEWFYESKNIGCQIKSPIELLVGLKSTLGLIFEKPESMLYIQKALGQVLLYPPNVAGWPGNQNWIDSSSLLFRMQLPNALLLLESIDYKTKADGDVNTEFLNKKRGLACKVDWVDLEKAFSHSNDFLEIENFILQKRPNINIEAQLIKTSEGHLKKSIISLMTLPEYQLC